jgi:MerR family transcriptional regulator, light-induced transcriptional regulator
MIITPAIGADPTDDTFGVRIAEVSRVLGVPMPTLRSWERRYDIPASAREPGRHRRYTPAELHSLRLMRDQIARGKPAAAAALAVRELLTTTGPAGHFITEILLAATRSDPSTVQEQLTLAHAELGLAGCLDDVLMPAMQQVGHWWATGRCDVDQEHLATEATRAWLETLTASAPPPVDPTPIVLACGPSDLHTIGLEALGTLLRYDRRACRVLGARTPVAAVLTAMSASSADAVVIVSHLSNGRARAIESIRASHLAGALVFFAGNAFSTPRSRRNLPGTYLGTRLEPASHLIDDQLRARTPQSRAGSGSGRQAR